MNKQEEHILLKTTAFIKMCDVNRNDLGSATCFFCKSSKGTLYLVTNNHVINKSNYCLLYLTIQNTDSKDVYHDWIFCELENHITKHTKYDLCIVDISHVYDKIILNNKIPIITYIPLDSITTDFKKFNHIEEIYMVGYPNKLVNSGINYPIVRKGITATGLCDTLINEEAFIVDIPVYRGSSGSPIYYITNEGKVKLVGITTSKYYEIDNVYTIDIKKTIKEDESQFVYVPNGLGYAVKSNIILELLNSPHNN